MDAMYQKCKQLHPQFYFNNLGLVHLKLNKNAMAVYYLSKAVKFLEKSNDRSLQHPAFLKNAKSNPNEALSNASSQKSYEIVFNYGLALFKSEKYYEAFKCFEKVSLGVLKQNPKLWFYMGLCGLKINQQLYRQSDDSQSDVFAYKLGYSAPNFAKQPVQQEKRLLLAPKGDPIAKMEQVTKDFEQNNIKEQKKFFVDIQKQINHD